MSMVYLYVCTCKCYMAGSVSSQENGVHCDWHYLARSGLPAVSQKKIVFIFHMITSLLIKIVRSRWLDIGLILVLVLWILTQAWFINIAKKNLAKIQP